MKKTHWLWFVGAIVLLLCAYLVGKSSSNQIQSTDIPQKTTYTQPATDNLQKKMQCADYRQQVQDNLSKNLNSLELPSLYQIFYSSSRDTCLSAKYIIYPAHGTVTESENLVIDDILTGQTVWIQKYEPALKYWDAQAKLDIQISVLQ